jgi:hypothetical protein
MTNGWEQFLIKKFGKVPNSICYKCLQGEYDLAMAEENIRILEEQEAKAKQQKEPVSSVYNANIASTESVVNDVKAKTGGKKSAKS